MLLRFDNIQNLLHIQNFALKYFWGKRKKKCIIYLPSSETRKKKKTNRDHLELCVFDV